MLGFFFETEAVAGGINFGNAIALGLVNPVAENTGFAVIQHDVDRLREEVVEASAVENIIAQNQTDVIFADEFFANDKSLRKAVRRRLLGIAELDAVVASVAEKTLESGQIVRGGYQQNVADAGKHQNTQRIIHHRLVVDGKHLLADTFGYGIKAGAGASRKYNSFHILIIALFFRPSIQICRSLSRWTWRRYVVSSSAGSASRVASSNMSSLANGSTLM